MKILSGMGIVLAGALVLPAAAQTQAALLAAAAARAAPAALTICRTVPEVQMVFAAQDQHGRPVLDLAAGQIRVLDDGVPAPLTSFQPADALPLRLALLLDASDSMRPGFAAERQAALVFLRGLRRDGSDQLSAFVFAAREAAAAADDAGEVLSAAQLGGQTALYDALVATSKKLQCSSPARRVLLLLSDGEDNYSRATLPEAIAALQEGNIAVYAITVHSSRLEYPGDRVLRQIAGATGGRAFLLPSYGRAQEIFREIESEVRAQYVLSFRPVGALAGGEFHPVSILALPRGTVIRTRAGYYVNPAE